MESWGCCLNLLRMQVSNARPEWASLAKLNTGKAQELATAIQTAAGRSVHYWG